MVQNDRGYDRGFVGFYGVSMVNFGSEGTVYPLLTSANSKRLLVKTKRIVDFH